MKSISPFTGRYTKFEEYVQTGKTTAIRRTAVRETIVSRYHGGSIEGPPETLRTVRALSY